MSCNERLVGIREKRGGVRIEKARRDEIKGGRAEGRMETGRERERTCRRKEISSVQEESKQGGAEAKRTLSGFGKVGVGRDEGRDKEGRR